MKGAGAFQNIANNPAFIDLLYVTQYCLNAVGAKVDVPAIIGYRDQPCIDLEECVDYAMTEFVPTPKLSDIGPGDRVTTYHFRSWIIDFIRQTALLALERPLLIERIRTYIGHVAWKVMMKQPITAHEKTLLIRFGSPKAYFGLTREEQRTTRVRPKVSVAETGNPLVLRDWERFAKHNMCGPITRFGKLISNGLLEQLRYSWGQHIGPHAFPIGTIVAYGPWSELRMTEQFTLDQSVGDYLTASREKAAGVLLSKSKKGAGAFGIQQPQRMTRGRTVHYLVNWDFEEVKLRVDPSATSTQITEYYWDSKVRQRQVSSRFGMQPEDLLCELALEHEEYGEGLHGPLSITDWPFIDLENSRPFLGDKEPRQLDFKEKIFFPKARKVIDETIDMKPFFTTLGAQYCVPAFCESVDVPLHWLANEQLSAEDFIIGQLNLTREEREQAVAGVRRSHNYAQLSRLFDVSQLPVDETKLVRLVGALSGI
jgi:hypothetical protein